LAIGAADRDALLLAAGEFARQMVEPRAEAEEGQELGGALLRELLRQAANALRQHDVLQRREFRQEMVELVDEADLGPPQPRAALVVELRGCHAADKDFAAIGLFEQTRDMKQGRLAGAARRDQRDEFARPEREIGLAQDFERGIGLWIEALDLGQEERRGFALRKRPSASAHPERFDGVEARRLPGRIERRQQRQHQRHHHHGRDLAPIDHRGHVAEEAHRRVPEIGAGQPVQRRGDRFDVARKGDAEAKPRKVPKTPIAAPVIRKTRRTVPRVAPIVRMIAMSAVLSFTSMIRPGDDVQRRHQHDQGQDDEHDVALDLQRIEEGPVALAPVGEHERARRIGLDPSRTAWVLSGLSTKISMTFTSPSRLK
jgi:hypothetical protein